MVQGLQNQYLLPTKTVQSTGTKRQPSFAEHSVSHNSVQHPIQITVHGPVHSPESRFYKYLRSFALRKVLITILWRHAVLSLSPYT